MHATEWEFRHRFWIIFGLFSLAFFGYFVDHRNASEALVGALAPHAGTPRRLELLRAILGCGALLTVAAAAVRSWAAAYLRSEVVHDTVVRTEGLVADGPYRRVRNPLYLGNVLLSLGMALLASRLGAVLLVVGQTLFLLRLIGREEAALAAAEGDRFAAYRAAVPRLVPALTPRVPAASATPHWGQGFVGEAFTWILAAATAAFAITLNPRILLPSVGAGLAVYWILFLVWKRRGRASPRAAAD